MISTQNLRVCNLCSAVVHSGSGHVKHMAWHQNMLRLIRAAIADAVKEAA